VACQHSKAFRVQCDDKAECVCVCVCVVFPWFGFSLNVGDKFSFG